MAQRSNQGEDETSPHYRPEFDKVEAIADALMNPAGWSALQDTFQVAAASQA